MKKLKRKNSPLKTIVFSKAGRKGYKAEAYFYDGLIAFTQLMTISIVIFGAVSIVKGSLDLADLLTFLLYIVILIEPIQRLGNFIRLYQEGSLVLIDLWKFWRLSQTFKMRRMPVI